MSASRITFSHTVTTKDGWAVECEVVARIIVEQGGGHGVDYRFPIESVTCVKATATGVHPKFRILPGADILHELNRNEVGNLEWAAEQALNEQALAEITEADARSAAAKLRATADSTPLSAPVATTEGEEVLA